MRNFKELPFFSDLRASFFIFLIKFAISSVLKFNACRSTGKASTSVEQVFPIQITPWPVGKRKRVINSLKKTPNNDLFKIS